MPTIRPYKIIDDEYAEQSSYTIDLDLPTKGILSSLMLMVKARTTTTGHSPSPWIKYLISSVSVNQAGQAFLNAAPPEVFQADAWYKTGKMPRRGFQWMGGAASEIIEEVPILFGDKLNDLEHTIDLSKLNDPKLSVTYNLAATGPMGETVWDTSYYPRFTVIAHLLQGEGIPASKGYQSLRQIEQYTPSDSEVHKLELKGTRPIKKLYLQFDLKNIVYSWIHSLDQVRIQGDNEAYVPFLMKYDDWYELIRDIYGLCEVDHHTFYALTARYVDMCVDHRVSWNCWTPDTQTVRPYAIGGSGRHYVLRVVTNSSGAESTTVLQLQGHYVGYTPWSTGVIDFEKMLNMEHLDPTDHAPVFLELEHTSNAATIGGPVKIHVSDLVKPV